MTRAESVHFGGEFLGTLYSNDWGVVFHPIDNRKEFARLRVKTWETVDAAKSEITKVMMTRRNRDG